MGNEGLSGQSAIEYLMTYGWMLLVVAVVGGAIFSVAQSESVDTVSGMEGEDAYINDFGVTSEDELGMDIQNRGSDQVVVSEVNVSDPDTGEWVFKEFTSDSRIGVGSDKIFQIPNVTRTDGANTLNIEIIYDSGALENLSATGTISGNLQLKDSNIEYEGSPEDHEEENGGETQTASGTVSASPGWENVEVRVKQDGTVEETVQTDENGEYSTIIETGTYSFEAAGAEANDIEVDQDIQLDFDLGAEEIIKDGTTEITFDTVILNDCEANGQEPFNIPYVENTDGELQIATLEQLQCMQRGLNQNYTLTQDIDASPTQNWNEEKGFEPVGTFRGSFDGNQRKIDELFIDRPEEDDVGIFSTFTSGCDEEGEFGNFTVSNFDITGDELVGYLVGNTYSQIDIQNETVSFEGDNSLNGNDLVGTDYDELAGNENGCIQPVEPIT